MNCQKGNNGANSDEETAHIPEKKIEADDLGD
jgi:hypothetical protein